MRSANIKNLLITVSMLLVSFGGNATYALDNQLRQHSSPYLALHGSDPVAWQDWTEDVAKQAQREGKLIYLSIGYFSCHWCHVMQRESYKNKTIAAFLNKHFIPVKIDRELEPALDARMIAFAEQTRGVSGWPLNVFLTPKGYPLYSLLYAPPDDFLSVVKQVQQLWESDKANLSNLAAKENKTVAFHPRAYVDKTRLTFYREKLVEQAIQLGDDIQGGFGEQSKFPSVPQLLVLLDQLKKKRNTKLEDLLRLTLNQMASQGLYDHIGGGFFRYATDPGWSTPHFEKMLYDNALMARLYLQAWKHFGDNNYKQTAIATLAFMERELLHDSGAMMASLSALDAQGREGGYYLFDKAIIKKTLSRQEYKVISQVYGLADAPPFDHGYLPFLSSQPALVGKGLSLTTKQVRQHMDSSRQKLFVLRQTRSLPRDTKRLAGWNGLALSTFVMASSALKDDRYLKVARGIRRYIVDNLWDGKKLTRSEVQGEPVGQASLEDYAYVAEGLFNWSKYSKQKGNKVTEKIISKAWDLFYDGHGWRMSSTSFIVREKGRDIVMDGPMPSPSAVIIRVSLELSRENQDKKLRKRALSALNRGHEMLKQNSFWLASHIGAMQAALDNDH